MEPNYSEVHLFSKRNNVSRVFYGDHFEIRKHFSSTASLQQEAACYKLALENGLTVPNIIKHTSDSLYLTFIPGETALELLEYDECSGHPSEAIWKALAHWCWNFYSKTNLCLGDPNLRNFIFHKDTKQWYGIDFETCCSGDQHRDFAKLLSFLLLYDPADTIIKHSIAECMSKEYCHFAKLSPDYLGRLFLEERTELICRRKKKTEVCK